MIHVPPEFRTLSKRCRNYPKPGCKIEDFFYQKWVENRPSGIRRQYLPIFWTHQYTRRVAKIKRMQQFINTINRSLVGPAFTIVQHADGIFQNKVPERVLVFGAGGVGDIPIPLIYEMPASKPAPRITFAHFSGGFGRYNDRTKVRSKMLLTLKNHEGFAIHNSLKGNQPVHETMQQCVFALCPRGFGKTSFRLYEAMFYGAIPVYIYDDPWLPYTDILNWSEFSVQCHISDIGRLPDILRNHTDADIRRKQQRLKEVVPEYFTLESTYHQIIRTLREWP